MGRSKFIFNNRYINPAGRKRKMPTTMKELREKLRKKGKEIIDDKRNED